MSKQNQFFIISVMGPYAGENEDSIFKRKKREIEENGYTFWHHQSNQAKPNMVQVLGKAAKGSTIKLILTSTASRRSGGDTKKHPQAKQYSPNENGPYEPIPAPIYVETGTRPWALVINDLQLVSGRINLLDYSDFFSKGAVRTRIGGSTVCALKQSSRDDPKRMKSNIRDIVATAYLVEPFSVWLSA